MICYYSTTINPWKRLFHEKNLQLLGRLPAFLQLTLVSQHFTDTAVSSNTYTDILSFFLVVPMDLGLDLYRIFSWLLSLFDVLLRHQHVHTSEICLQVITFQQTSQVSENFRAISQRTDNNRHPFSQTAFTLTLTLPFGQRDLVGIYFKPCDPPCKTMPIIFLVVNLKNKAGGGWGGSRCKGVQRTQNSATNQSTKKVEMNFEGSDSIAQTALYTCVCLWRHTKLNYSVT